MSLIHDVIKIKMVQEGYLPNYPYHLISDEEMCDAFLNYPEGEAAQIADLATKTADIVDKDDANIALLCGYVDPSDDAWAKFKASTAISWFKDKYPLLDDNLEPQYRALVEDIAYHLKKFKNSLDDDRVLPDWVYTYMLGTTLSVHSNVYDLHDMFVALDVDNIDDIFTAQAQAACYRVSFAWLQKYSDIVLDHRHPTLFGEPHVIKALRLDNTR